MISESPAVRTTAVRSTRSRAPRAWMGATAIAAATAILAMTAPPAAATTPEVLLSTDGRVYTAEPRLALVDGLGRLVPGESISTDFWMKNPTDSSASLRISARDVTASSTLYGESVTVSVWNSGSGQVATATLAELTQCDVVVPPQAIARGAAQRTTVTFAMADLADEVAQNQTGTMSLLVSMRDAAAGPFPASACDDEGVLISPEPEADADAGTNAGASPGAPRRSTIAYTGAGSVTAPIAAAALLIGIGAFLVASRRRRSVEDRRP